jgi:hypothetical protein
MDSCEPFPYQRYGPSGLQTQLDNEHYINLRSSLRSSLVHHMKNLHALFSSRMRGSSRPSAALFTPKAKFWPPTP